MVGYVIYHYFAGLSLLSPAVMELTKTSALTEHGSEKHIFNEYNEEPDVVSTVRLPRPFRLKI